ncbi:MAG TPA: hypothetical protein VGG22_05980 [Candidatus Baltobacteraceae bacterium]|jgi:flagellar biosynthesis/type III secretory pathway protein FliH
MSPEFKSLAEILRESRAASPLISPLIAQPLPEVQVPEEVAEDEEPEDRLLGVQTLERFEAALRRLLEEIAAEVIGRELLLAPIDVARIVLRLKERYGFEDVAVSSSRGDLKIEWDGTEIDASLGRRLHAAIERAMA